MKKVRIGVIGLGMGRRHIKGYQVCPAAEVVAICDTDAARLAEQQRAFGVEHAFTDAEEMMDRCDLDAVSVAVPNAWHAPLTIAALQRGLHVFCEKPMAMTVREAEQMQAAAIASGKNLMINFIFRFFSTSFALKRQVEAGVVGDIYFGRTVWHRRRGFPGFGGWFGQQVLSGGGSLIDLGVHRLDLALWLMGSPEPVSVSGVTYDYLARAEAERTQRGCDVEDLACGMIKFANGATLLLETSWALNTDRVEELETKLYGTKGGLMQRNLDERAPDGTRQFFAEVYTAEGGDLFTKRLEGMQERVPTPYAEFVQSILEERAPLVGAEDGIKVMRIVEALYQSAATGREVRVARVAV